MVSTDVALSDGSPDTCVEWTHMLTWLRLAVERELRAFAQRRGKAQKLVEGQESELQRLETQKIPGSEKQQDRHATILLYTTCILSLSLSLSFSLLLYVSLLSLSRSLFLSMIGGAGLSGRALAITS